MQSVSLVLFPLLFLLASCSPAEDRLPARAPTRQQPLEVVTADTPAAPPVMQASRGKNGTGKEHDVQFAAPPPISRPASAPPPRPPPPPPRSVPRPPR